MAATDARPVPLKNTAYRVVFPIYDADGDLVTGAAALDSEVSKDQGTFADCTNEATEIATASGMYYLDLTSTEMNADCVTVIVKTTTTGAKTTPIVLYPQESGDIKVDLQSISGSAVATGTAQLGVNVVNIGGAAAVASGGRPEVNVSHFGGSAGTFAGGRPEVNATHWAGTAVATPDTAGHPKVTIKSGSGAGELNLSSGSVNITTSSINAVADQVWDEATSGHLTAGSYGAAHQVLQSGTMQAGSTSTTAVLATAASSSNDYYNNSLLMIIAGTGAGQSQYISDYVGATRAATINGTWVTTPDNTSVYVIIPGGSIPGASAPTADQNAAAVWNALSASYEAAGSFGELLKPVRRGTAQAGASNSITLDASASATDNLYRYQVVRIISGTGAGQARQITAYTGGSKVATVAPAWTVVPDNTSVFKVIDLGIDAATVDSIATGVWAAQRSSNNSAGSFGEYVLADVLRLSGDVTAADNAESFFDGTGYAGTNNVIPTVTTVTNAVNANVTQISGDTVAADNLEAMLDGTGGVTLSAAIAGNITGNLSGSVGSVVGAVGSVAGNVGGNVVGSVASVTAGVTVTTNNDKTGYRLSATGVDDIWDEAVTEPSGVFAWASATPRSMVAFLAQMTKNKQTLNRTTGAFVLRNNADSSNVGTATHADDGTTTTKGAIS